MANSRQKTGKTPTRANASRSVGPGRNGTVVGALGILLALWLLYGTVTIHPFLWGTFAEELIAALCVVFALRLLCIANLPKRLIAVCLILLPAGIILYGAYAAVSLNAYFYRYLCLAGTAAFVLLVARLLDGRPDGVVLTALLLLAALPVLSTADTQFTHELMRLFLTAGVFFSVVSIREKTVWMAFCSAVLLGVAGIAGLYAAFVAAGTAAGLLLASPKRQRGVSWLVAALAVGLSLAGFALAKQYLPSSSVLFLANAVPAGSVAAFLRTHLMRVFAAGVFLLAIRSFRFRENALLPVVFALLGGTIARLAFQSAMPDVWMDAPLLTCLTGTGIAKVGRRGR